MPPRAVACMKWGRQRTARAMQCQALGGTCRVLVGTHSPTPFSTRTSLFHAKRSVNDRAKSRQVVFAAEASFMKDDLAIAVDDKKRR